MPFFSATLLVLVENDCLQDTILIQIGITRISFENRSENHQIVAVDDLIPVIYNIWVFIIVRGREFQQQIRR